MHTVVATLKPEQFYEWRCKVEEVLHSKTKLDLAVAKQSLMEKNVELERLKAQLFKDVVKTSQEKYSDISKSYEELKKKLEGELGVSLADKVIDEVTFEVKQIANT